MRLQSIPQEVRSRAVNFRWDRIIEKHEGPEDWKYLLKDDYVDFLRVAGFDVLLPIDKEKHANITIDRCIASDDGKTLTIFLQDTTTKQGCSPATWRFASECRSKIGLLRLSITVLD